MNPVQHCPSCGKPVGVPFTPQAKALWHGECWRAAHPADAVPGPIPSQPSNLTKGWMEDV